MGRLALRFCDGGKVNMRGRGFAVCKLPVEVVQKEHPNCGE